MIVQDPATGRYYDDETGEWADPPVSRGQAIAVLLLAPLVFVWYMGTLGIDVLAWLDRLGR